VTACNATVSHHTEAVRNRDRRDLQCDEPYCCLSDRVLGLFEELLATFKPPPKNNHKKEGVFPMFTFHFNLPSKRMNAEEPKPLFVDRGEIYIETENGYFPCIGWSDLLLSVVIQWIGNCISMLDMKHGEQNVTNHFMNGPYFFALQKGEEDSIKMRFIKRIGDSEEKEKIPSLNVAFADYCDVLLNLTERIINDPAFQWFGKEQDRTNFKRSIELLRARL
jgi:hypothetical protein